MQETAHENQFTLRDGRRLGFALYGDIHGEPVFYLHGFPGSRLEARLLHHKASTLGVSVIAIDRPGYGLSTSHPRRRLGDWPSDVAELADFLDHPRFAVLGVSGGGPYALSVAAGLKERVRAAGIVCGLGPLARSTGAVAMSLRRRAACSLCRRLPWMIPPFVRLLSRQIRRDPRSVMDYIIEQSPNCDRLALQDPAVNAAVLDSFREAVRPGVAGSIRDLELYLQPWDFDVREITSRVTFWHGEQDRTVPAGMSRALAAQISGAESFFFNDDGHYSLPVNRQELILRALLPDQQGEHRGRLRAAHPNQV